MVCEVVFALLRTEVDPVSWTPELCTVTTVRDGARQAPDLVDRNFTANRPNMLWVADITYIPTWAGFLYLAVVLDAFSRRIVGWSMATTLHTQVVGLAPVSWTGEVLGSGYLI